MWEQGAGVQSGSWAHVPTPLLVSEDETPVVWRLSRLFVLSSETDVKVAIPSFVSRSLLVFTSLDEAFPLSAHLGQHPHHSVPSLRFLLMPTRRLISSLGGRLSL